MKGYVTIYEYEIYVMNFDNVHHFQHMEYIMFIMFIMFSSFPNFSSTTPCNPNPSKAWLISWAAQTGKFALGQGERQ